MTTPTRTETTWEILSKTSDGETVVICITEAHNADEAKANTANFCDMMGCTVVGVREETPKECEVCGGEFPCADHAPCDICGTYISVWFAKWPDDGDTMLCDNCHHSYSLPLTPKTTNQETP